jgi:hypothetical protein
MFSATGKLPAFSDIPTLNHPALGKLEMFLVYHGEGKTGYMYEAVINHLDGASIAPPLNSPPKKKKKQEIPTVTPPQKNTPVAAPPVSKTPRKPGVDSQ